MVNLFSLPGIDPPRLQPDPTLPVPVPAPVNPFQVGGVQVPMTSPYQVINDGSYSGLVVGNMTDRDRLVAAGYRDPVRIVERGLESMVPRRAATNRDPLTRASEQLTSAMIEGERLRQDAALENARINQQMALENQQQQRQRLLYYGLGPVLMQALSGADLRVDASSYLQNLDSSEQLARQAVVAARGQENTGAAQSEAFALEQQAAGAGREAEIAVLGSEEDSKIAYEHAANQLAARQQEVAALNQTTAALENSMAEARGRGDARAEAAFRRQLALREEQRKEAQLAMERARANAQAIQARQNQTIQQLQIEAAQRDAERDRNRGTGALGTATGGIPQLDAIFAPIDTRIAGDLRAMSSTRGGVVRRFRSNSEVDQTFEATRRFLNSPEGVRSLEVQIAHYKEALKAYNLNDAQIEETLMPYQARLDRIKEIADMRRLNTEDAYRNYFSNPTVDTYYRDLANSLYGTQDAARQEAPATLGRPLVPNDSAGSRTVNTDSLRNAANRM